MPCLIPIWFDIDGTILHASAGRRAFQKALFDTYGWQDSFESVVLAGNTDLQVLMDLSRVHAGDEKAGLKDCRRLFERMAVHLDAGLADDPPRVVPGAPELIRKLVQDPRVIPGLITGNARDCAFIKLKHVDLDVHFSEGGFGDQHADRNELAALAKSQLAAKHVDMTPGWIIGDTPRDIEAAKHIGARCLGVSSHFSPAQLREAGADQVVEDLFPSEDLMELLLAV